MSQKDWTPESSDVDTLVHRLSEAQARIAKLDADIATMIEDRDREVHWYRRLRYAHKQHFPVGSQEREAY